MLQRLGYLLRITRSAAIARRYFVTNGFDGALTMLGLNMGFLVGEPVQVRAALGACVGAAIALAMSGVTSAYISEAAEKTRELRELEQAMVADLNESAHAEAARFTPLVIAVVNGLSPLLLSLLIIAPLWLSIVGIALPISPHAAAIMVACALIFLLGVFLGRVSGQFWLWTGVRALVVAGITSGLIWIVS